MIFLKWDDLPASLSNEENKELFLKNPKENAEVRNKLITGNLRFVMFIINRYYSNYNDKEELFSEGVIGLIKAVDKFDVNRNIQFSSYSSRVIMNDINRYFNKIKNSTDETSLSELVSNDLDNDLTLMDVIVDDNDFVDNILRKEYYKNMNEVIEKLTEDEKKLLYLYFYKRKTQTEVSQILGITQSYASKKIIKVLKKARNIASNYEFQEEIDNSNKFTI